MSGATPSPSTPVTAGKIEIEFRGPLFDARGGELLTRYLNVALMAGATRVEGGTVERTPVNTGLLRGSIGRRLVTVGSPDARGIPERLEATVGTPITYGPHVEYGTRPHMPPHAPIEAWVRRKLTGAIAELAGEERTRARAKSFVASLDGKRTKRQERRLVDLAARERAVQSLTFLVRRSIATHGTKGSAAIRTATEKARGYTLGAFNAAVRRWAEDLSR